MPKQGTAKRDGVINPLKTWKVDSPYIIVSRAKDDLRSILCVTDMITQELFALEASKFVGK